MSIQMGEKMPFGLFRIMRNAKSDSISTDELFGGKKVVLFSVPGAFTPTCSINHLPGFIDLANDILGKGVDTIACMAVNDVFVMDAWGKSQNAEGKVLMLADGNGEFTAALGLELDASGFGMGRRSQRFSLVVNDGEVEILNVEDGGELRVSSCEFMLDQL